MRKPILTSLIIAAALTVPAAPALAAPSPDKRPAAASSSLAKKPAKSTTPAKAAKAKAAAEAKAAAAKARARKRAFVYNGTITAVDAAESTLTVKVRGGTVRAARGTTVVINVPATAVVKHDGVKATLDALGVGDKVTVKGTRAGMTVQRVTAVTPEPVVTVDPEVEPTS